MSDSRRTVWLPWTFRILWFVYAILLAATAHFHGVSLGKTVLWMVLSAGLWRPIYQYFAEEDIIIVSATLVHGKSPVFRAIVVFFFLALLVLLFLSMRA